MVGGIESRAFENDSHRRDHLLERFLPAFGADFKRGIVEGLLSVELHSTRFTTIGINRHLSFTSFLSIAGTIIARAKGTDKTQMRACYNFLTFLSEGRRVENFHPILCGLTLHRAGREPGR